MTKNLAAVAALIFCSPSLFADVWWGEYSLPEGVKPAVEVVLTGFCPSMMIQEEFEVTKVQPYEVDDYGQYLVEISGYGHGSGDPEYHFVITVVKTGQQVQVVEFASLKQCH